MIKKKNQISNLEEALECEELWDINNGRVLCENCHKKTDTWGIKANKFAAENKEDICLK